MEIPEHLRELVDQLGQALVQALATDPASRALARRIQAEGYEVTLMLEATVALHKRDTEGDPEFSEATEKGRDLEDPGPEGDPEGWPTPEALRSQGEPERSGSQWSEEDRAFLRTFKISLD
jgi:hypothetical protein